MRRKVVVIGDGACGKTCLSVAFSRNEFPEEHIPTIYDSYEKCIMVGDNKVELSIWDTAGEEDYDRLRPLSYTHANAIIICFAIDNPVSLKNVTKKWAPEVKYFCPTVPLVLVGNKLDLRNNPEVIESLRRNQLEPVKIETGLKVAKRIKARYIECSAKNMWGIRDVFHKAAELSMADSPRHPLSCCCFSKFSYNK